MGNSGTVVAVVCPLKKHGDITTNNSEAGIKETKGEQEGSNSGGGGGISVRSSLDG